MDADTRKYLTATSELVFFWLVLAVLGITGPVAEWVLVLGTLGAGFAYLGPRAVALGVGVHLGESVWLSDNAAGRWKPPPLESHVLTYEAPIGMLVHQYRGVRIMHDTPWSGADIISCEMCRQEGIQRWPEGAAHPTIQPGELVIKEEVQRRVRPFWPRP